MTSILLASLLSLLPPARPRGAPAAEQPAPGPARTLTDAEVQDRVEAYLGTIDTRASTEDWRALGARGAAVLEQVAQDPRTLPTRRAKAVAGLSAIGASTSGDVLVSLARSEQAPLTVRLAAVDGAPFVIPAPRLAAARGAQAGARERAGGRRAGSRRRGAEPPRRVHAGARAGAARDRQDPHAACAGALRPALTWSRKH